MGRWLIVMMLVMGALAGAGFYHFLQKSPEARLMVRDHLKSDFMAYAIKNFQGPQLSIPSVQSEPAYPQPYTFKLQEPWGLDLVDQKVVVSLPQAQGATIPERVQKELYEVYLNWLKERYPLDTKLRLEVKFQENAGVSP